ncbi:unnamed protein product [Camellia sinensis]
MNDDGGRTTTNDERRQSKMNDGGGRTTTCDSESESHKEHCNYFKFADEDDDDSRSTIRSNVGPRNAIRTEELNDIKTRLCEMDNEILQYGTRLKMMEKNFKIMIYVIIFCVILHFIM